MTFDTQSKVQSRHLKRNAYLYIRQSSPRQVFENIESSSIPSFSGVLSNKRIKRAENLSEKNRNLPIDGEDRHERQERVEYWLTV